MRRAPKAALRQEETSRRALVLAPMPGMVVSYEGARGSTRWSKGDVVVILEAMKMENFITSPVAGTVRKTPSRKGRPQKRATCLH
ncbi:MAG: acetyl-CoA carboxylase biotin carboxyl carrier protein subunit [Desulfobacterales bacterium]|nr:acetyl-CoA carboxylase biotin carboxyl carrier protein subunit [Desulfobacterales bacterium]